MINKPEDVFFSVIIPTRNRPIDFKKALDSVLMQSYQHIEVIVVNDGTNKKYRNAYDKLESNSPDNVTYINLIERSRGHGHCFARNQGVDVAIGNFICFLDDDDWWVDEEFLSRAALALSSNDCNFYFANQKAVTQEGKHVPNVWVESLPEQLSSDDPRNSETVFPVTVEEMLKVNGFPHQNCWAIATELYNNIGGMDENLRYEPDREIYIRALDQAKGLLYDKTTVALHNIPNKNLSSNASTKTSVLEKLIFQLRTVEKGILFSEKNAIQEYCKIRKGHLLKKITEELLKMGRNKLAYFYCKEALAIAFNFKWLLFSCYCLVKRICGDK